MKYGSEQHHRRSIRLKGYDYSKNGAYFITICTQNHNCLFGNIADGIMRLNDAGEMIDYWWRNLEDKFCKIRLDEYIIMPNHFHGILMIQNEPAVGAILCNRPMYNRPMYNRPNNEGENVVSPLRIPNVYNGLGQYMSWFKRMSTNEYIRRVKIGEFTPFEKSVWQRNYYEHIIRHENDLNRIREYIAVNPYNWESDELFLQ